MSADAALLAAERQFFEAKADARKVSGIVYDEDYIAVLSRAWDARDQMGKTPAVSAAGAAAKLRVLLDPELGIETGDNENDLPFLRDVLTVLERLADT